MLLNLLVILSPYYVSSQGHKMIHLTSCHNYAIISTSRHKRRDELKLWLYVKMKFTARISRCHVPQNAHASPSMPAPNYGVELKWPHCKTISQLVNILDISLSKSCPMRQVWCRQSERGVMQLLKRCNESCEYAKG